MSKFSLFFILLLLTISYSQNYSISPELYKQENESEQNYVARRFLAGLPPFCTSYAKIESAGKLNGDYVRFYINNNLVHSGTGKGLYILKLDASGTSVVDTQRFQIGTGGQYSHVDDMITYINALPNDTLVLVGAQGEVSSIINTHPRMSEAYQTLRTLGSNLVHTGTKYKLFVNDAYALLGRKGQVYGNPGVKSLRGPSLFPGKVNVEGCIDGCGENSTQFRVISKGSLKGNTFQVYKNGNLDYQAGSDKGTDIVVYDEAGNRHDQRHFGRTNNNSGIVSYLATVPTNYIVIAGVKGSATSGGLDYRFFKNYGSHDAGDMLLNQVFALIGRQGYSQGQGVSDKASCCGSGTVDISHCINGAACDAKCGGQCSGTPDNCTGTCAHVSRINFPTCECQNGFYALQDVLECQPCAYMCSTCEELANVCTSCSDPTRDTNSESCQCLSGYFQEAQNITCSQCNSQICGSCENTADNCLTCSNNTRDLSKSCDCADGYFQVNNDAICSTCDPICKTCETSSDNCLSCSDGFFMNAQNKCEACSPFCATCTQLGQCDSCQAGINRTAILPICYCTPGFYSTQQDKDCDGTCNPICKTCSQSADNCLTCADGYYMGYSGCEQCSVFCDTCSILGQCDSCKVGLNRTSNLPNCECLEGFYSVNQDENCNGTCGPLCKTCEQSADNCSSCIDGYFLNDLTNQCEKCSPLCKTCTQFNECTECSSGLNRELTLPSCGCKENHYYNIQQALIPANCQACDSQCKSCDDLGKCTECAISGLIAPDCLLPKLLKRGYFSVQGPNNSITDKICDIQCKDCEDQANNCTQCIIAENRSQKGPECLCEEGFHDEDNTQENCEKCGKFCDKCSNSYSCQVCTPDLNRELNVFNAQCECLPGFIENKNKECVRCYQYDGDCFLECPNSTVQNEGKFICEDIKYDLLDHNVLIIVCGLSVAVFGALIYAVASQGMAKRIKDLVGNSSNSQQEQPLKNNNNNKNDGESYVSESEQQSENQSVSQSQIFNQNDINGSENPNDIENQE